jgi:hypothetical protein
VLKTWLMVKYDVASPPVRFAWNVSRAGYRWVIAANGTRVICAANADTRGWSKALDVIEYNPLEKRTGLFREFAALKPTKATVQTFANMFGLLEAEPNVCLPSNPGTVRAHGEDLNFWKTEIQRMKFGVELWDAWLTDDRANLTEPMAMLDSKRWRHLFRPDFYPEDTDIALQATQTLEDLVDYNLNGRLKTRFKAEGASLIPKLILEPQSLLGAMWLQFAAAVEARKTFIPCARCSAPFEVSRDHAGRRSDARFCSDRCRVGYYRDRIDQARTLGAKGMTTARIARELDADVETVRGWLGRQSR